MGEKLAALLRHRHELRHALHAVAHRVDVIQVGPLSLLTAADDLSRALIVLNTGILGSKGKWVWVATNGHQHSVNFDGLVLAVHNKLDLCAA